MEDISKMNKVSEVKYIQMELRSREQDGDAAHRSAPAEDICSLALIHHCKT